MKQQYRVSSDAAYDAMQHTLRDRTAGDPHAEDYSGLLTKIHEHDWPPAIVFKDHVTLALDYHDEDLFSLDVSLERLKPTRPGIILYQDGALSMRPPNPRPNSGWRARDEIVHDATQMLYLEVLLRAHHPGNWRYDGKHLRSGDQVRPKPDTDLHAHLHTYAQKKRTLS